MLRKCWLVPYNLSINTHRITAGKGDLVVFNDCNFVLLHTLFAHVEILGNVECGNSTKTMTEQYKEF